jgi:tetratricopeptide (TPR) repeat protein
MADRYFYIPSIGLFIALVFGLADIAKTRHVALSLSAAIAGGVLLVLATLTNAQLHRWSNSFTLFNHALAVTRLNLVAEQGLGLVMVRSGRYDEAAAHFAKALRTKPDFLETTSDADIRTNLGLLLAHQHKLPEAAEQLNEALRLNPNSAEAHVTLGVVLLRLGKAEESIPHFSAALRIKPDWALAQDNLKQAQAQINKRQ